MPIATQFFPLFPAEVAGIEALTRFSFNLDSDSDPLELVDSPSPVGTVGSLLSTLKLPTIQLPHSAKRWTPMFDQLLLLAQTKLPNSVDQLNRLLQLYSEMNKVTLASKSRLN